MSRIKYLLEQIERARRFAASMTNAGDREGLNATADNLSARTRHAVIVRCQKR
jgi:hypothetical protein